MKHLFSYIGLFIMAFSLSAQPMKPDKVDLDTLMSYEMRSGVSNESFTIGEKLTYRVHYGFMDAGEAQVEVKQSKYKFAGRDAYHIVGTGTTLGAFDWFFKVRDRYETYIDKDGMFPHRFVRDCNEGGYEIKQDYTFYPKKRAMKDQRGDSYATPFAVQDMLSGYFYIRTLDFNNIKEGDIYQIDTYMDDEVWPLKIKYKGTEVIKTRTGKYRCKKFVPIVQEGRIFKDEDDLNVWITDDANKIPILVKSKILVGSIKMELTGYEGLSNELALVTKK